MRMMLSKRGLEKLIMYDELLASDSGPKDGEEVSKSGGILLGEECNSTSLPRNHPTSTTQPDDTSFGTNNNNNNNHHTNTLGSMSLLSLSDSSYSPRLDNSRSIASLASFSLDPPSTSKSHPNSSRLQTFLLDEEDK